MGDPRQDFMEDLGDLLSEYDAKICMFEPSHRTFIYFSVGEDADVDCPEGDEVDADFAYQCAEDIANWEGE